MLFRSDLLALLVHQHHVRPELLADVRPSEIQEGDQIDTLDVILPLRSFLPLPGDGFRDVVDAPSLEIRLLSVLHFHDDLLVIIQFTIDVVDQRSVIYENGR